jgi:hypothetical protein
MSFSLKFDDGWVALLLFYIVFSVGLSLSTILNRNKWFEFDRHEADNKESFIFSYCFCSFVLAAHIGVLAMEAVESYQNGGMPYVYIILIVYLGFNKLNICSLFNFDDHFDKLFPLYECNVRELPEWKIRDIERDVAKYVMRRDFNIDIDELERWKKN